MTTVLSPPDQGLILENISWDTYERLLGEHQNNSGTRFTYSQGKLEIMVLSARHEKYKDLLTLLVNVVAEQMGVDIISFGSTTFRRQDLERGFEPDACFYIQKADQVSDKDELDLNVDPPPDLIIEVDISNSSLDKLPVFAASGVSEVWRYDGKRLTILHLSKGGYNETQKSVAFPQVTRQILDELIIAGQTLKRLAWLKQVRERTRR